MSSGNIFEGNISLNYRNNKLNVYSSYNGRTYNGYRNKFSDIYENVGDDSIVRLNQSRIGTDLNNSQSFRAGVDLSLSERHKLGVFGNLSLGRRERRKVYGILFMNILRYRVVYGEELVLTQRQEQISIWG